MGRCEDLDAIFPGDISEDEPPRKMPEPAYQARSSDPLAVTPGWDRLAETGKGKPLPTLHLVNAAELLLTAAPKREWVVPDLIPGRQVTLLGGDGGVGKSLLALQLAVSVTAGVPWIGQWAEQGRVLYVSAEDEVAEHHRRLENIVTALSVQSSALSGLDIIDLADADSILAAPRSRSDALKPTAVFDAIEGHIQRKPPNLIIVDTLADVYGGDENHRAQVRSFVRLLRGLCFRYDLAVVVLAHPSLTGIATGSGLSGSTAWNGSVRSRLYLEPCKDEKGDQSDPDLRRLSTKKANYAPNSGEVLIRYDAGAFRPEVGLSGLDRSAADVAVEDLFLALLKTFQAEGRTASHLEGRNYAPKQFAAHPHARGIQSKGFAKAMERLFAKERIRSESEGPASRRRQFLVATGL